MKLKVGDKVLVIAGKDKGKQGKITKTLRNDNKVIVEKINIVKKHVKPQGNDKTGGIIDMESPIHASNVQLFDSKTNKPTRKRTETLKEDKKVAKKATPKKEVAKKEVAKKTTKKAK